MHILFLFACLSILSSGVMALEDQNSPDNNIKQVQQSVNVKTLADPVDKSYRKMLRGMDLFEKLHAMAPDTTLRYQLLPRRKNSEMQGIKLKVVGETKSFQVPIAEDNTFTLERNQLAWDEDASVMTNRKADTMTWRTQIRTPNLPPNTRRLGDLRLECRVGREAGLLSPKPPIIGALASVASALIDLCDGIETRYFLFADKPIFSVTMVSGSRRETIPFDEMYAGIAYSNPSAFVMSYWDSQALLDRTFFLPLGDHSWPDDTLIEFEYMESAPSPSTNPQ